MGPSEYSWHRVQSPLVELTAQYKTSCAGYWTTTPYSDTVTDGWQLDWWHDTFAEVGTDLYTYFSNWIHTIENRTISNSKLLKSVNQSCCADCEEILKNCKTTGLEKKCDLCVYLQQCAVFSGEDRDVSWAAGDSARSGPHWWLQEGAASQLLKK